MKQQRITFSTADSEGLKPGLYELTVTHEINGHEKMTSKQQIFHTKPRFTLQPEQIHNTRPGAEEHGDFSKELPCLTLQEIKNTGFLRLLLLSEEDQFSISQASLSRLITPIGNILTPKVKLMSEIGEKLDTPCTLLELPIKRLQEAICQEKDIPYLSHVRQVATTENKASVQLEDGTLLCLCSHRPPVAVKDEEIPYTACLISVEGLELPKECTEAQRVQLPCLFQWKFFQAGYTFDFAKLATELDTGWLYHPLANHAAAPARLTQGYIPLLHQLRSGSQTVSYYRGPLLSFCPVNQPYSSVGFADALTCYDPDCGMFDVSLSTAWQLGRLISLQNGAFVSALETMRHQNQRRMMTMEHRAKLLYRCGMVRDSLSSENDWQEALDDLCLGQSELSCQSAPPPDLQEWLQDASRWREVSGEDCVHQRNSINWLEKLEMLQGVPFNYLVPDEAMLPSESLRYFYLDPVWIRALTDGACSPGRQTDIDHVHDDMLLHNPMQRNDEAPIMGILLRSALLRGWKNLEVYAYAEKNIEKMLSPLRIERLSDDVMLGLFNGEINCLELVAPVEQLTFICDSICSLRDLSTGKPTGKTAKTVFRADNRALDFCATALAFSGNTKPLTPDELALQLTGTGHSVIYYPFHKKGES